MRHPISSALIGALLVSCVSAASWAQSQAPAPAKLPFELGKDTTIITSPLLPDGMPDYISVLNERHGRGVTPESNSLIPLLQIRPLSMFLENIDDSATRDQFVDTLGMPALRSFAGYLKAQRLTMTDPAGEIRFLESHVWSASQHPEVAAFLKSQAQFMDTLVEASNRPRFFFPLVSRDGHISKAIQLLYPGMSVLGQNLCLRVTLRASDDINDAIADAMAVKRLARLLSPTSWLGNVLAAIYEERADCALAAIAASGMLTTSQCDAILKSLDLPTLAPRTDFEQERFELLDNLMLQATGQTDISKIENPDYRSLLKSVDIATIDWNEVLRFANKTIDEEISVLNAPSVDEMKSQAKAIEDQRDPWIEKYKGMKTFERGPGESPADYTQRFAHWVRSAAILPNYVSQEQRRRDANMRSDMVRVLLAAAKFHAQSGNWPKDLKQLVPNYLAKLPPDPYASTPGASFRFDAANDHPAIDSVGPDHTPDTGDDIILGDLSEHGGK